MVAVVTDPGLTPNEGIVEALHRSPARGIEMRSIDTIEVIEGHGIVGDRYAGTRHRHVSVQAAEDLLAGAADLGSEIPAGSTRRNITTTGFVIPIKPGDLLTIGTVRFEVVRIAAPCKLLDDWIAPGARTALRRRGGSILRALSGGTISVGDPVIQT